MMNINGTALLRATIADVWLIAVMAIATEIFPSFKTLLTQFAGQHWTGKSIISVLAFAAFYVLFKKSDDSKGILGGVLLVAASAITGGLAIFLFYIWHFLSA